MLSIILSACVLVAATVMVHAAGIAALLRSFARLCALPPTRIWAITRRLLRMVWLLVLTHLAEISVWALFYRRRGCLPDAEAAFYYFSGVTYTTIGYGDLVLAKPWRLLGPVEGWWASLCSACLQGFSSLSSAASINPCRWEPPPPPPQEERKHEQPAPTKTPRRRARWRAGLRAALYSTLEFSRDRRDTVNILDWKRACLRGALAITILAGYAPCSAAPRDWKRGSWDRL